MSCPVGTHTPFQQLFTLFKGGFFLYDVAIGSGIEFLVVGEVVKTKQMDMMLPGFYVVIVCG